MFLFSEIQKCFKYNQLETIIVKKDNPFFQCTREAIMIAGSLRYVRGLETLFAVRLDALGQAHSPRLDVAPAALRKEMFPRRHRRR